MLYSLQGGQKEYSSSREKRYFEKLTLAHLIKKIARLLCRPNLYFVVIGQTYLRHYLTLESNLTIFRKSSEVRKKINDSKYKIPASFKT